jgi:hypothetical protein
VGLGVGPTPDIDILNVPENALFQLSQDKFDELFELLKDSQIPLPL